MLLAMSVNWLLLCFIALLTDLCSSAKWHGRCAKDADCELPNMICRTGVCKCAFGAQVFKGFGPNKLIVKHVCEGVCSKDKDCDSANHETCVDGICNCQSNFNRVHTPLCVGPTDDESKQCPKNHKPNGFQCDNHFGYECNTKRNVICHDTGFCCKKIL